MNDRSIVLMIARGSLRGYDRRAAGEGWRPFANYSSHSSRLLQLFPKKCNNAALSHSMLALPYYPLFQGTYFLC